MHQRTRARFSRGRAPEDQACWATLLLRRFVCGLTYAPPTQMGPLSRRSSNYAVKETPRTLHVLLDGTVQYSNLLPGANVEPSSR